VAVGSGVAVEAKVAVGGRSRSGGSGVVEELRPSRTSNWIIT
jgi:hypothetical protein